MRRGLDWDIAAGQRQTIRGPFSFQKNLFAKLLRVPTFTIEAVLGEASGQDGAVLAERPLWAPCCVIGSRLV